MLGDVIATVSDGLLGFETEKGTGIFVAIGVSPVEADAPITITGNMGVAKIRERLGLSPLADSVMDSVENGASRIYCIPVKATTAGTISEVSKTGDSGGGCSAAGSPNNAYSVMVEITGKGGFNTALFTFSLDGGFTRSEEATIPLAGAYEIPGTGVTLTFAQGEDTPEESFQVGDSFAFTTTAPQMTNADALAAIDKLRQFDELFEFVHIVGESTAAMWAAVSTAQTELETQRHKPLLFILESGKIGTDESVDDYALRLEAENKKLKNKNVAVVAARSLYVKMDGTTTEVNNASILCGLLAKTSVQQSVGRTRESAGMGISKDKMLELRPAGIKEYIELLDSAKYITFREYDGLEGFYVTNARVMSPDGSDYRYIEDVRVVNKIVREVRKAGLPLLQEDIDVEDTQGELERRAKYMEDPLDEMVRAKEISSAQITVPEGQDIIKDERMDVVVRYVSRGYIRTIHVDIGRANATS